MKALFVCNDPPCGTERSWNGVRLAGSLSRREAAEVRIFPPSQAVGCAVEGQQVPAGHSHPDRMATAATRHG